MHLAINFIRCFKNFKDTNNNIINEELTASLEVKIDNDIKFTDEDIEIEGHSKIDFKYDLEDDDKPEVNLVLKERVIILTN